MFRCFRQIYPMHFIRTFLFTGLFHAIYFLANLNSSAVPTASWRGYQTNSTKHSVHKIGRGESKPLIKSSGLFQRVALYPYFFQHIAIYKYMDNVALRRSIRNRIFPQLSNSLSLIYVFSLRSGLNLNWFKLSNACLLFLGSLSRLTIHSLTQNQSLGWNPSST